MTSYWAACPARRCSAQNGRFRPKPVLRAAMVVWLKVAQLHHVLRPCCAFDLLTRALDATKLRIVSVARARGASGSQSLLPRRHLGKSDRKVSAMPSSEKKEAKIACTCNACGLTLADGKATLCALCGCEDCRQALQWAYKNGGIKPDALPRWYYMRSDIIDVKGRDKMIVRKLREDGVVRRIYCANCYSLLGNVHPIYQNNIFGSLPKHCINSGDLTAPLSVIFFMNDYSESIGPIPVDNVPIFQSLRFPQEVDRLLAIPAVANSFKPPTEPIAGITMSALMESLGPPLVLNLEKGKDLLS